MYLMKKETVNYVTTKKFNEDEVLTVVARKDNQETKKKTIEPLRKYSRTACGYKNQLLLQGYKREN